MAEVASSSMQIEVDEKLTFSSLDKLLLRKTPFGSETGKLPVGEFEAGPTIKNFIKNDCKVLVVGAGGLGCELLKDLALSGFRDIHVIDLDTIDLSNLNRQFLFRMKDVGRPKAIVAAEFIMTRCPHVKVTPYHGKVQDHDSDFYSSFNLVISGLDNIEARRWLNSMLVAIVELDEDGDCNPDTIVPLIDGGTEGFKGQARVILPRITSCFECSLDSFPPQKMYPLCTIAETPRLPEHCISYAHVMMWPNARADDKLDKDNPEHMRWIFERAQERAEQYGIEGVTYMLTMGVVKNIIPAVASTNALVSAVCVSEALKILTYASQQLNTYMMYMGTHGVYAHTFEYGRKPDCPVCSSTSQKMTVDRTSSLEDLIELLRGEGSTLRLTKPSLTKPGSTLYMQKPPLLEKATRPNLTKPLSELITDGEEVTVTDPVFPGDVSLTLVISFTPECARCDAPPAADVAGGL